MAEGNSSNSAPLIILIVAAIAVMGASGGTDSIKNSSSGGTSGGNNSSSSTEKPTTVSEIEQRLKIVDKRVKTLDEQIKETIEKQSQSQYFGLISLRSGNGFGGTDARKEYLTITASTRIEPVSLSGWKLVSDSTATVMTLGRATNVYYPQNLTEDTNVILSSGGKVVVVSGISPVGISFRSNICTGYLNRNNVLTPSLPQLCPYARDENLSSIPKTPINDKCFDYIDTIPRCKMPTESLGLGYSAECAVFVAEKINYKGCVDIHRNDTGFLGNEWRVFLGRNETIWKNSRETIRLVDNLGKTVATYIRR
ncbi:MAG: hypothetical protein AAB587_01925 [Patescibacteria group bacterium]